MWNKNCTWQAEVTKLSSTLKKCYQEAEDNYMSPASSKTGKVRGVKQEYTGNLKILAMNDSWSQVGKSNSGKGTEDAKSLLLTVEDCSVAKDKDMISPTTWLGDSTGALCHVTNLDKGMVDVQMIRSSPKIGSGKSMMVTKIGKKTLGMWLHHTSSGDCSC
jgi:hypothetical protein